MFDKLQNWLSASKRKPATRCCCFHFGRCGSTLLGNMLAAHPEVDWRGELLHPLHEKTDQLPPVDQPTELITAPMNASRRPVFGFEAKFQHLDGNGLRMSLGRFVDFLVDNGFEKFVVLKRQNYLRQAISVARGQQTGNWHQQTGQMHAAPPAIKLDVDAISLGGTNRDIVDAFRFLDTTYSEARECFMERILDVLEIDYERDLESDPQSGFAIVSQYLGIADSLGRSSVQKIGGGPIEQLVSNFDEIQQRLGKTEYQWMTTR